MTVNFVDQPALRRARVATALFFLAYGTILGAWTARIPAVKQGLGLTDGELSLALLGFAAGAITGMQVAGRVVDRFSGARVMVPVALLDALLLIAPAYAPSLLTLVGALFAFGAVHGTLNIAMNASAVQVEQAWRKPIMSSFHAVYSIGGFLGAAAGGLFAHSGADAGVTFAAVAAIMILTVIGGSRWVLKPATTAASATHTASAASATHATSGTEAADGIAAQAVNASDEDATASQNLAPTQRMRPLVPGIVFLGVLAFCCLVGEGAAADWASVYLRDTLGSSAGFAAAGYAAFSIMMTVGRLVGDRLAASIGPVRLVRACALLGAGGLGIALLVAQPIAGVIGFGLFGAGLSCIAPLIFSAAGSHDPAHAGRAIARVASLGWIGFLTGPIVIGSASGLIGLGPALALPVVLALFVAATAAALRPPARVPAPA